MRIFRVAARPPERPTNANVHESSNSQAVSPKHVAEQTNASVLGERQKGNHEEGYSVPKARQVCVREKVTIGQTVADVVQFRHGKQAKAAEANGITKVNF